MKEILANNGDNGGKTFILEKGNEKFGEIKEKTKDYFEISRDWFSPGVRKNWEHEVEVSCNRYFKHFGFINHKPKISKCLIYDNTTVIEDKYSESIFIQ